jgi:hypothetical protein
VVDEESWVASLLLVTEVLAGDGHLPTVAVLPVRPLEVCFQFSGAPRIATVVGVPVLLF